MNRWIASIHKNTLNDANHHSKVIVILRETNPNLNLNPNPNPNPDLTLTLTLKKLNPKDT